MSNQPFDDPTYVPAGHSCTIIKVQWYPIDSGIFLSSDSKGFILVWDTNIFTPAAFMSLSKTGLGNNISYGSYHG